MENSKKLDVLGGCLGNSGLFFTAFSLRIVQCGPAVEQTATPRKILCWPISLGSYKLGVIHDHRALLGSHLCDLIELGQSTAELVKKSKRFRQ